MQKTVKTVVSQPYLPYFATDVSAARGHVIGVVGGDGAHRPLLEDGATQGLVLAHLHINSSRGWSLATLD